MMLKLFLRKLLNPPSNHSRLFNSKILRRNTFKFVEALDLTGDNIPAN